MCRGTTTQEYINLTGWFTRAKSRSRCSAQDSHFCQHTLSRNFSSRVFFAYLPVVLLIGHTGQRSRRGHHRRCAQQQGLLPFGRHPSSLIFLAMASSGGDTAPGRLLRCPCKDADGLCLEFSNLLLANGHPLGGAFRFETSASSKNRKFQSVLVRNLCVPGTKLVGRAHLGRTPRLPLLMLLRMLLLWSLMLVGRMHLFPPSWLPTNQ